MDILRLGTCPEVPDVSRINWDGTRLRFPSISMHVITFSIKA
jgi:hypothetical protein